MKYVVALLLLAASAAGLSSSAGADTSDRFSQGGWIEKFQPAIDQANASGELFRIRGHCQSNCTLFLGVRNVCVERSAQLRRSLQRPHSNHFLPNSVLYFQKITFL